MSSLLVVVKSHFFPQFVHLNRERGTSRQNWGGRRGCGCQWRVGGHGTRELHVHIGGTWKRRQAGAGLTTYAVYCRRSHKMKQSQNTRVVSGGRRGGSVLAGERKDSGSQSGEWRGSGVLTGTREKATAVACTWAAPGQRENTETVAK